MLHNKLSIHLKDPVVSSQSHNTVISRRDYITSDCIFQHIHHTLPSISNCNLRQHNNITTQKKRFIIFINTTIISTLIYTLHRKTCSSQNIYRYV